MKYPDEFVMFYYGQYSISATSDSFKCFRDAVSRFQRWYILAILNSVHILSSSVWLVDTSKERNHEVLFETCITCFDTVTDAHPVQFFPLAVSVAHLRSLQ